MKIGSYRIEQMLGRGGFGVVYAGVDTRLERRAAIKQLLPELSTNHEIVERFFNEAKAAAGIDHPGIVEIYEVGWHTDGSAYFAMKLLDGDSLAKRLRITAARRTALAIPVACTIARQVASALVAAHARGIIHRDLKPDNIVLVPDDEVAIGERATVLDFGIAKLFTDKPDSQLTKTGMMMGTPAYMSPEQCRGAGEVDARTDVYALACILFEMLAGRPPFVAQGAGELLGMHLFIEPPDLRALRADVPRELAAITMRALAKQPEQRLQMIEFAAALQPFATGGRTQSLQVPTVVFPHVATPSGLVPTGTWPTPSRLVPTGTLPPASQLATAGVAPRRRLLPMVVAASALAAVAAAVPVIAVATDSPRTDEASLRTPGSPPAPDTAIATTTSVDAVVAEAPIDAAVADTAPVERAHTPAPKPPPAPSRTFEQLLADARAATTRGQHALALAHAELALAKRPGDSQTVMLAATAACNIANIAKAARYIGMLDLGRQRLAQQICARNGVDVSIAATPLSPPPTTHSRPPPRLPPPPPSPFPRLPDDDLDP